MMTSAEDTQQLGRKTTFTQIQYINYLQQVIGIVIIVDDISHTIDKLYDTLSIGIGRGSLTSKQDGSGDELLPSLCLGLLQKQVPIDDVEDIHELSLVLMNSLDLYVEEGIWVNLYSALLPHPLN